jgi:hypothetical protein
MECKGEYLDPQESGKLPRLRFYFHEPLVLEYNRHAAYALQPFTLPEDYIPPYLNAGKTLLRGPGITRHFMTQNPNYKTRFVESSIVPVVLAEAYDNMFRLMHGLTVKFDKNIDIALEQAENLVAITTFYCCPHLLRHPSLVRHFLAFDRGLFIEIMLNAPRWLKLSLHLEAKSIFKEAMIHMVGKYRSTSWKSFPLPKLSPAIWSTIKAKHDDILKLKTYVDAKLVNNTAVIYGPGSRKNTSFQTWLVSDIWHHWVGYALNKTWNASSTAGTYAVMYRLMDAGGDAYLPAASLYEDLQLREQDMFEEWGLKEIEQELDAMKAFAQTVVNRLCINRSVLDVKEFNIEHMTCCMVDDDDIPWLKRNRHNAIIEQPAVGLPAPGGLPPSLERTFLEWALLEKG